MVPVRCLVASFGACTLSLQKPIKNMFFGVKTFVGETCLGQSVALYGACDTNLTQQQRHYLTQHPAFEPKFDQIRARFR